MRLLLQGQGKGKLRAALVVLCVGTGLLLLSVLAWWNFGLLLSGEDASGNGNSTYMVIGKQITEQTMGNAAANTFSENETKELLRVPQVLDAGEVTPALFPVYAVIGGRLAMSTELPLECVPDRFLEELPDDWNWQPGNRDLPVILSSRFLDIYNYVFAPGQGLPQLSRQSVRSVGLKLQAGGAGGASFAAHVSGFSDRIGSVLVPASFIAYGNSHYAAPGMVRRPSQLILKVKDPSDGRFTDYLQQHGYVTEPQQLRWSRMRAVVEVVTGATGILALVLMVISALVFVLFIELTITRASKSIVLLQQLGYDARTLRRFMGRHFLPMIAVSMIIALLLCVVVQYEVAAKALQNGLLLPSLPGWPVLAAFGICLVMLALFVTATVAKAVNRK